MLTIVQSSAFFERSHSLFLYGKMEGVILYATRFETDDLVHRLLVLLQVIGAVAFTINIHGALAETLGNFATSVT